jgi:hypothetical protein
MKFFVPDQSPEHADDIYNDFRTLHNAADKQIRSITFMDRERRPEVQLCVGENEPWYGGRILLILLCYPRGYQVFTQERGIEMDRQSPFKQRSRARKNSIHSTGRIH